MLLAAVAFSCEREVTTPASPTTTSVKISDETMLVKDGLVYISSFSSGAILEDEFKARNTRKQSVAAIDAVKSFISADEAYLAISPDDYSTTEAALGINTPYAFVEERGDETYVEPVIDDDMLRHLGLAKK